MRRRGCLLWAGGVLSVALIGVLVPLALGVNDLQVGTAGARALPTPTPVSAALSLPLTLVATPAVSASETPTATPSPTSPDAQPAARGPARRGV